MLVGQLPRTKILRVPDYPSPPSLVLSAVPGGQILSTPTILALP